MAPKGGRGEAKAEWKAVGATEGEAKVGDGDDKKGGKGGGGGTAKGKAAAAPWQNRDNGEGRGKGRGAARPWQKNEGGKSGGGRGAGYGGEEDYYEGGFGAGGYGGGGGGGGYGAAGYGGGYGAAPWNNEAQEWPQEPTHPPPPPAPRLWTEYVAPDGTAYYYNSRTGLTQWDRPAALDPPKPEPKSEEKAQSGDGGKGGRGPRMDAERDQRSAGDGRGGGDRRREGQGERRDAGAGGERGAQRPRRKDGQQGGARGGKGAQDKEASDFGPPGCNLFVFHLPDDWTDDDLNEYFAPHGTVISAKVMKELGTGRSRGFGFVSYEDRVSAATAIKKMQGYKILGKRLKVEFKKGEGQDQAELDACDIGDDSGPKKSYPDDERLIGYLRAISAKNVVQSLKESEGAADEDEPGMASSPLPRDGDGDEDEPPADD